MTRGTIYLGIRYSILGGCYSDEALNSLNNPGHCGANRVSIEKPALTLRISKIKQYMLHEPVSQLVIFHCFEYRMLLSGE